MPQQYSAVHAGAHHQAPDGFIDEVQQTVFAKASIDGIVLDLGQQDTVGLLSRNAMRYLSRATPSPSGDHVYMWGPPGRGKTWILGAFFDALPTPKKRRFHFHDFFRQLHASAHKATTEAMGLVEEPDARGSASRGRSDRVAARSSAIEQAIESMLGDVEILCFDEFHCNDPGDAMLLARMLKFIMERRILLITTSNYPPEELLADEYYHHLILPSIAAIREHMSVHELDGQQDYRTLNVATSARRGYNTGSILIGAKPQTLQSIGLTEPLPHEAVRLKPTSHEIGARRAIDGQLWFDFSELCESLTAPLDYLELAKDYDHWIISGVPASRSMTPFGLRRMANAIDVLYDHDIRLDLLVHEDFSESLKHLPELDAARLASRLNALQNDVTQTTTEGANT